MGGRGGSSGLNSGNSFSFPTLEGSERQVAWAKDIRESYVFDKSVERYVQNYGRQEDLKKKEIENAENTQKKIEIDRKYGRLEGAQGSIQNLVLGKHTEFKNAIRMREQFIPEKYRDRKSRESLSPEERKKMMKRSHKEYGAWLIREYKKIMRTEKSAKWWIDHR